MSPGIGIVVMDHDQHDLTNRCLASLAEGDVQPDVVVLVENGRRPVQLGDKANSCAETPPVVLRSGQNLNCAGGRTLGLNFLSRNTPVEILVTLDNDTVAPPAFVSRLAQAPPKPHDVVAPVILDLDSGEVWSSGGTIDGNGAVVQLDDLPDGPGPRQVDWAPGACLAMHRATWAAVGEFDPWIEFLFEDIEWCHRLANLGGRILVGPDLRLGHEPHQSLGGRWSPARVRYWSRNGTFFRLAVLKAGLRPTARWVANESLLSVRDLTKGRFRWSAARVGGLAEGLLEASRRVDHGHMRRG